MIGTGDIPRQSPSPSIIGLFARETFRAKLQPLANLWAKSKPHRYDPLALVRTSNAHSLDVAPVKIRSPRETFQESNWRLNVQV